MHILHPSAEPLVFGVPHHSVNPTATHHRHRHSRAARPRPAQPHNDATYAFIDGQNVHRSVREQGWNLDWTLLRGELRNRFGVSRALLFVGFIAENEPLYAMLRAAGFELVFTQAVTSRRDGKLVTKGNVDTDLVLRAMIDRDRYAHAVIVSGDGDFHPLASHLDSEGKLTSVLVPAQRKASRLLRTFGNRMVAMDDMRSSLETAPTHRRTSAKSPQPSRGRRRRSSTRGRVAVRADKSPGC